MQPTMQPTSGNSIYYGSNFYDSVAQSVIYDEVAAEEEYMSRLRPHRTAPVAPSPLSAQQIQRRMEKAKSGQYDQIYGNMGAHNIYSNGYSAGAVGNAVGNGGGVAKSTIYDELNQSSQQRIQLLMKDLSHDATEQEAKDALHAVNWDHNQAVRHFKVERLLR